MVKCGANFRQIALTPNNSNLLAFLFQVSDESR